MCCLRHRAAKFFSIQNTLVFFALTNYFIFLSSHLLIYLLYRLKTLCFYIHAFFSFCARRSDGGVHFFCYTYASTLALCANSQLLPLLKACSFINCRQPCVYFHMRSVSKRGFSIFSLIICSSGFSLDQRLFALHNGIFNLIF